MKKAFFAAFAALSLATYANPCTLTYDYPMIREAYHGNLLTAAKWGILNPVCRNTYSAMDSNLTTSLSVLSYLK